MRVRRVALRAADLTTATVRGLHFAAAIAAWLAGRCGLAPPASA